jgi:hypothetical protein
VILETVIGRHGDTFLGDTAILRECVMLTLLEKLNISYNEIKFILWVNW